MIQSNVLYLCDQKKCEKCSAPEGLCFHTTDIRHATNFIEVDEGIYMETEVARLVEQQDEKDCTKLHNKMT